MRGKYPLVLLYLRKYDPTAVEELKFHPVRRWRFDFACPSKMIAIEVDGGCWSGGRHSGGKGQVADMVKGNEAAKLGWFVLHFTPQQLFTPVFFETMEHMLLK